MKIRHPKKGDKRTKEKFLLFPKTIGLETRWLERARWEDEFRVYLTRTGVVGCWEGNKWLT